MKFVRERKFIASMPVEDMATALQDETSGGIQMCSEQEIARSLDISVNTVHTILINILHCYPDKIAQFQELLPDDLPVRHTFDLKFFARMEEDNEWP